MEGVCQPQNAFATIKELLPNLEWFSEENIQELPSTCTVTMSTPWNFW